MCTSANMCTHIEVIVQLLKLRLELRIAFSHSGGTLGGGARAMDGLDAVIRAACPGYSLFPA